MPDTLQSPATILIESRYWVMNARLLDTNLQPGEFSHLLANFQGTVLNGSNLSAEIVRHPLDNYSETTPLLKLTAGHSALAKLSETFLASKPGMQLSALEFWLTDLEMLCSYAVFTFDPQSDIKVMEQEEMGLVDLLSSLQPDLEQLFLLLESKRVVAIQQGFVFGVPETLRKENLHTPDYSYLYSWHIFFPNNRGSLERTIRDYGNADAFLPYAGGKVYPGWGLVLWDPCEASLSSSEMIRRIFIDSISGTESVIYDNSIYCFTGFLDQIIRNQKMDCHYIRNVCNISHLVLQRSKLWKRNLSVEQQVYHERLREIQMLEAKKTDFDSSEATLLKAVEGIDVQESQKSGRAIELVLSFFTALSLYSIATDIYTIITTDSDIKPIHPLSIRTILIFLATGVVVGFFYLLRKQRKN
jgi:hypothetical protein